MENANKSFIENYGSILLLLLGIIIGCLIGIFAKDIVPYIKPLGDIFLNLLFVSIIPLIFLLSLPLSPISKATRDWDVLWESWLQYF